MYCYPSGEGRKRGVAVWRISKHGKKRFKTMKAAALFQGVSVAAISRAVRGSRKTAGGYQWEEAV